MYYCFTKKKERCDSQANQQYKCTDLIHPLIQTYTSDILDPKLTKRGQKPVSRDSCMI